MPRVICDHCAARINVPDQAIGKQAPCPKCGVRITLLRESVAVALPVQDPEPEFTAVELLDDEPPAASPPPSAPVIVYRDGRAEMPPEPWYYGFLWSCAALVLCLNIAAFLIVAILLAIGTMSSGKDSGGAGLLSFGVLLILAPSLVATFFSCGFLMLVIDVARNIRGIRYRDE